MAAVTMKIIDKNGKTSEFNQVVGDNSKNVCLSKLLGGVKRIQEDANALLTDMVNAEKANGKSSESKQESKSGNAESDDEDDEVDEDEIDEPPEKKCKS